MRDANAAMFWFHGSMQAVRICKCALRLGLAVVATVALLATALEARDRPGTPNDVRAFAEGFVNRAPTVMVAFKNTASESVRFWVEWKINGQPHTADELYLTATCSLFLRSAGSYSCSGWPEMHPSQPGHPGWFQYTYTSSDESDRDKQKGFFIENAAFNTEYCFRFKAQEKSNGVVSELWSAWACTRTPDRPPLPPPPHTPEVDFLKADDAPGRPGAPTPPRVLVKWNPLGDESLVAYYIVEESSAAYHTPWPPATSVGAEDARYRIPRGTGEHMIDFPPDSPQVNPQNRYMYRVCAVNVSGKSCSVGKPLFPNMVSPNQQGDIRSQIRTARQNPHGETIRGADICKEGYVWREAVMGDHVCVTPQTRNQAKADNARASERRQPGSGAYGPDTCKGGFVWREATETDHVCVTIETRAATAEDNRHAAERRLRW
jgi:hypothetical protein